jgi:surface protein
MSPTKTGGPDAYYPNYDVAWPEGYCANTVPMPSGRPVYTTMLGCCKGAYGGQTSGACIAKLPSPPTMAPTKTGAAGTDYYPNYDLAWPEGVCINTQPIPSGRPVYTTQLACCKAAYGGQTSGACIKGLASPPTMAPTKKGGPDAYYPDYSLAWREGKCINTQPMPSGRPVYTTLLACCKAAYGGQTSGACIKGMANPPTFAPSRQTTQALTSSPTSTPSKKPTTPKPTTNCFPDRESLETAVDTYITNACGNVANSGVAACTSLASSWGSPISNWCTSLVTDMSGLFYQKSMFNEDVSGWDVSKVTNMAGMFAETTFNQDISGWNVASVTVMHGMFYGASAFNQDISGWNVGLVTSMESMFKSASAFNQDISGWNVGSVTSMALMFESASAFNHDISGWNVGSVIDMQSMFAWASAFNQDISGWDVTSVTNMDMMFDSASEFNQNMCPWKDTIPFIPNYNIFASSGCTYTATPVTADDPFCAVPTCSI